METHSAPNWKEQFTQITNPVPESFKRRNFDAINELVDSRINTALIIVDNQNAFLHNNGWGVKNNIFELTDFGVDKVMENIILTKEHAQFMQYLIIYLQFCPSQIVSPNCMKSIELNSFDLGFYGSIPEKNDIIIQKGGNSGFDNPMLLDILFRYEINHLLMTGFFLGACVSATASDAIKYGFGVTLPKKANCVHNKNSKNIKQEDLKLHYLGTHNGKEGINIGNF